MGSYARSAECYDFLYAGIKEYDAEAERLAGCSGRGVYVATRHRAE